MGGTWIMVKLKKVKDFTIKFKEQIIKEIKVLKEQYNRLKQTGKIATLIAPIVLFILVLEYKPLMNYVRDFGKQKVTIATNSGKKMTIAFDGASDKLTVSDNGFNRIIIAVCEQGSLACEQEDARELSRLRNIDVIVLTMLPEGMKSDGKGHFAQSAVIAQKQFLSFKAVKMLPTIYVFDRMGDLEKKFEGYTPAEALSSSVMDIPSIAPESRQALK